MFSWINKHARCAINDRWNDPAQRILTLDEILSTRLIVWATFAET
jgi:hypothetical protein